MTSKQEHINEILTTVQNEIDNDLTARGFDMFANESEYTTAYTELRIFKSELVESTDLMPDSLTDELAGIITNRAVNLIQESALFASEDAYGESA